MFFTKNTDSYLVEVPMGYVREVAGRIDWESRLIAIKGPKGVGKSTMMLQYIKNHFKADDRHVLYCSADTSYFTTHSLMNSRIHGKGDIYGYDDHFWLRIHEKVGFCGYDADYR